MSPKKSTRKPRPELDRLSASEQMERFIEEIVRRSKELASRDSKTAALMDPQILRSDGLAYPVSAEAIRIAHLLAAAERGSSKQAKAQFSANTYQRLSLIALGDTYSHLKEIAASAEDKSATIETEEILQFFRSALEGKLAQTKMDAYRHIPCHLFHANEPRASFDVGPVRFFSRMAWAEEFLVEDAVRANVLQAWEEGSRWSPDEALSVPDKTKVETVLRAIGHHGWIGSVLVQGHDAESSHAKANVLVDLAIDSLNVMLPPSDGILLNRAGVAFFPGGVRLATTTQGTIVAGSSARLPGLGGHPDRFKEFLAETADFRQAAGHVLASYAEAHQDGLDAAWLIERWVNALHWFGGARREDSDFMAVVKYGCALDILSGAGGNLREMTEYVEATFGITEATDQSGRTVMLEDLLNSLFNDGRSALAHGESFGLLNDRSTDRARADVIVRQLIESGATPLGQAVRDKDRILSVDKDSQMRAFKVRLRGLSRERAGKSPPAE